ncbi:MAG TPA: serine/threonine-protein kinase [Kofleriaceae bacterium]|nr:serine/threonine-protein kinase [Kofleriaceae bacterium]
MTHPPNLAGVKLGNYRLIRVLGRGNMGVVYLATDEALLRPTAVKVLTWAPTEHDPEAWFLAEARSVARLNHPSVIQIYGVARHGPYCYIAMEYVEGVSADVMISRGGVFTAEHATEVMLQIAEALELAHTSGIIHRDIKPANILIKNDGSAKLGDFGMAVSAVRAAQNDVRAGTPHYFAPEIWRNEPASVASDLYAVGATYYYLLAGRPPFDTATIAELSVAHQRAELAVPPELASGGGASCMRVIRRCMAKHPAERQPSAREVAWELRGVLRDLASGWPAAPSLTVAQTSDVGRSSLGEPSPAWRDRGFVLEPFAAIDPGEPPYRGAPFDELRRELRARLQTPGTTLVVTGESGSGRTALARAALAGTAGSGAYIDLDHAGARPGSLVQRIARAFGAVAGSAKGTGPELDSLLEVLAKASPATGVPLIVLDGVTAGSRAAVDAAVLARAARSTRYFNVLVVGVPELALAEADRTIGVPPLAPHHVGPYLDGWLRATRPADAPPVVVTIDAALLVGLRTEGNLDRINALARQMFASGGPVFTSWDAWAAPDDTGRYVNGLAVPPARPAIWPTPEVLRWINECRATAGLAERAAPDPLDPIEVADLGRELSEVRIQSE